MERVLSNRELDACLSRARFLVGMLFLLLVALLARYFQLMVVRHRRYLAEASGQLERTETVAPRRGTIRDRRGRPLAMSRCAVSVAVDPSLVAPGERDALAGRLAAVLGLPAARVRERLAAPCRFRWLRRGIEDRAVAARVRAVGHRAVIVREEPVRAYPAGGVGAQLIGFTNVDGKGLGGAERTFDAVLGGRPGRRLVLRDGRGGTRTAGGDCGPVRSCRDGRDVVLAMDLTVQTFAEEALRRAVERHRPECGVALVLDPRNGDVLALAGYPSFRPGEGCGDPRGARAIRAVTDCFEIGSAMKPLIAAAALERGVVAFDEVIDCEASGVWRIGGRRTLHDHHAFGPLPFPEILIRSSNIGIAKIAARLGPGASYRCLRALGFGRSTGSGLPFEAKGVMTPLSRWDEIYTLPSVAMGHQIAVTPLQFAIAFSALVNGGVVYRPRVALRVGDRKIPPSPRRQIYSEAVVRRFIVPTLERVVTEGTGRKARVSGYRVGGKTGTAQILNAKGENTGYVSSFIGFGPVEEPRFLVMILLKRPVLEGGTPYGGTVAAPFVAEILERCLKYAEVPPASGAEAGPPAGAAPAPSRSASPGRGRARLTEHEIDLMQYRLRNGR